MSDLVQKAIEETHATVKMIEDLIARLGSEVKGLFLPHTEHNVAIRSHLASIDRLWDAGKVSKPDDVVQGTLDIEPSVPTKEDGVVSSEDPNPENR